MAVPPSTGTCQMSQLSLIRTDLLSFVQPNGCVGGSTMLWSFSVLMNETGAPIVMFFEVPLFIEYTWKWPSS